MKIRTVVLCAFFLITIDQAIKIIINIYFLDTQFEIIPSLLEFKPTFNVRHSWVNTLLNKNFGLNVGLLPHVILYIFIGVFISALFSYLRNNILNNKKLIDAATIFFIAALLCALIGNLIWKNGTLDYIYLKPFFVFDLKDIYIDFFVVLIFIYVIKNRNQKLKMRDVFLYAKDRLKRTRNKKH